MQSASAVLHLLRQIVLQFSCTIVASQAAPGVAIIADGDTGYGNAMNVKRTVRGFANAGLAGVLIEDQVQNPAKFLISGSARRCAANAVDCTMHSQHARLQLSSHSASPGVTEPCGSLCVAVSLTAAPPLKA